MKCPKCNGYYYHDGDSYKCLMGHRFPVPLIDRIEIESDIETIAFLKGLAEKEHISQDHLIIRAIKQYQKRKRIKAKTLDPQGSLF